MSSRRWRGWLKKKCFFRTCFFRQEYDFCTKFHGFGTKFNKKWLKIAVGTPKSLDFFFRQPWTAGTKNESAAGRRQRDRILKRNSTSWFKFAILELKFKFDRITLSQQTLRYRSPVPFFVLFTGLDCDWTVKSFEYFSAIWDKALLRL